LGKASRHKEHGRPPATAAFCFAIKWSPSNKHLQDHLREDAAWAEEQDTGTKISADVEDKLRKIFCIKTTMEEIRTRYPELYRRVSADAMREYIKSLVAFLFFSSNWYFLNISGYFDGASHLKPLLHTWSLSVEEQFYILFPVSILLIKRFNESALPRFILFVFVISLASNIYLVWIKDLNGAFYNSIGRFWEIALGALIACGFIRSPSTSQTKDAFGVAGLAMIGVSITFGSPTYPTLWTLMATIGTASVILAQGSKANRQLAAKPLVGLGLISYAFYLWHWPLFAFLNVANATSIRHFALAILIAFALSVVSYVAIERPIRYRAPVVKSRQVFAAFACSMILFLSIGVAGIATNGFESRFSNRARDYEWLLGIEEKQQKTAAMRGRCWMGVDDDFDAMIARCISPPRGRPRILLAGDSHAAHFVSGFKRTLQGIDVDLLAFDTCSLTGMFLDPDRPICLAIIRFIDNLKKGDFDAVILSTQVVLSKSPVAAQKCLARIEQLTKITTVYVLGPIQYYRPNMPTIYMKSVGEYPTPK
jgi:SGNH domain (fused to AT3 domains)/Acyltransferase family